MPALSIAIALGFEPVVAHLTMDTGLGGIVVAGVVVAGGVVVFGVVAGDVAAGKEETGVVTGVVAGVEVAGAEVAGVVAGVEVAGAEVTGVVAGVEVAGAEVAGVAGVVADGSGVWSIIVGSARTLLSAMTGCAGVATSVDSSVGTKMGSAGIETDVASRTFGGSGAVARQSFLPFARPHTQTTAFFLRMFPGVVHATDFPRAEMVAYQMLLSGVFAHTTETLETFDT